MPSTTAKSDATELAELMRARSRTYGMLSRLFLKEVDEETLRELQGMRFPQATGNAKIDEGYHQLYEYLRMAWDDSITELAIDFVRTFIGHGVNGYSAAYPFESVYTSERRLMMQEARAEVLATLRANNLKRGRWTEGEDHIALELEFMQIMSERCAKSLEEGDEEAAAESLSRQLAFANEHLLNWFPLMAQDMRLFSRTLFYQGLAQLTLGYLESDAALVEELLDSARAA